ncbi:MAG: error-prone DNA polymerase, partial [Rhodovulum sulfidophilum]
GHPVAFLRADLARRRVVTCADAMDAPDGRVLTVAGLVLPRQRPGSAKGVFFVTLEDETGVANVIVWPKLYERQRRVLLGARLLAVRGRVQREGSVVHLIARELRNFVGEAHGVRSPHL